MIYSFHLVRGSVRETSELFSFAHNHSNTRDSPPKNISTNSSARKFQKNPRGSCVNIKNTYAGHLFSSVRAFFFLKKKPLLRARSVPPTHDLPVKLPHVSKVFLQQLANPHVMQVGWVWDEAGTVDVCIHGQFLRGIQVMGESGWGGRRLAALPPGMQISCHLALLGYCSTLMQWDCTLLMFPPAYTSSKAVKIGKPKR